MCAPPSILSRDVQACHAVVWFLQSMAAGLVRRTCSALRALQRRRTRLATCCAAAAHTPRPPLWRPSCTAWGARRTPSPLRGTGCTTRAAAPLATTRCPPFSGPLGGPPPPAEGRGHQGRPSVPCSAGSLACSRTLHVNILGML